ncbi:NUDIX domain-containing protein [Psychromicrobium xiongbiense]|uniref:NUDIX domain-containing protein n=1 Tax=Psychromicrobium xiongbiense TaxID=3051184 RepID=UPI0025531609|nr:NUDIX hydrolase [Psychromicrobium sp. YIM S02556]
MSLHDGHDARLVLERETVFHGKIWDVVSETFELSAGGDRITRQFIDHPGAVAILPRDDAGRVLMLRQYRHPVRASLWEIPAGLLDVAGEDPLLAAARELLEEADLRAERWQVLVDNFNSAGSSSESVRIYLAEGLSEVSEAERHVRTEEEAEIQLLWVPLEEAVTAVLAGEVHSFSAIAGILALSVADARAASGQTVLRPGDAPWPMQPEHLRTVNDVS